MISLKTPVSELRMIGSVFSHKLDNLDIKTIENLLNHIPRRYEDFSLKTKINLLQEGERVTVCGKITDIKNIYTKYGKKIQRAVFTDDTGSIEIIWYNQPYLVNYLKINPDIYVAGIVKTFSRKLVFESPDFEIIKSSQLHTGRLVPIYPETSGITSKWIRTRIDSLLHKLNLHIMDYLPQEIRDNYLLLSENDALNQIHFPKSFTEIERAKRRLMFDELFLFQLKTNLKKREWKNKKVKLIFETSLYMAKIRQFINELPFELTSDQNKAINEIIGDLTKNKPMNRLLEGDVGSGKTVVAAVALYLCCLNGYKGIFMAPTEILARQHFEVINNYFTKYDIKIALMTGKSKPKEKQWDIMIGTHAILYVENNYTNVGLVIIDEQQRFGVEQRIRLREKGNNPHLLTMTATPIPRTIALTLYSDLDLSTLNLMPKGRIKPKTWIVPSEKRNSAYEWIRNKITETKCQAFIVCPFIEISDSLESVKSAKEEFKKLKDTIFPLLKIGLLHGRLNPDEKNRALKNFSEGKIDILVSTPVVEVGIDIPNASIILIEGAERFGLAQLHQLRGRIGRRNQESFCLLFSESNNSMTMKRLKILQTTYSGSRLSELDLKLRGMGDMFGTKQHGLSDFKIADITDLVLIKETKEAVNKVLTNDPYLSRFPLLRGKIESDKITGIAPD